MVICSETNRHHGWSWLQPRLANTCLRKKPTGIGRESREIAESSEKANLLFTTGYFMRADPKHLFLKEEIAQGTRQDHLRPPAVRTTAAHWAVGFDHGMALDGRSKIAGVGALASGAAKLDILMWLLGDVESVTADIRVVTAL